MKTNLSFWRAQSRRIDALSLRERAIVFSALAVAAVSAADALVLSPGLAEQKAMTAKLRLQSSELDGLRSQLQASNSAQTPAGRLQQQLRQAQAEQQRLDREIDNSLAAASQGTGLQELLERVLRRHDRLVLQNLATAGTPTGTGTGTGADPAAGQPGAGPRAGSRLPLQGVDIALRGAYPDLAQYIADAEREMPGLRWGELSILGRDGTAELSARVFLVAAAR